MTDAKITTLFAIGIVLILALLLTLDRWHGSQQSRRFIWILNSANVETWNGACLDLQTRQLVPSIHCEE